MFWGSLHEGPTCFVQDVMSANPISCKATDKATAAAHAMIDVSLVLAFTVEQL